MERTPRSMARALVAAGMLAAAVSASAAGAAAIADPQVRLVRQGSAHDALFDLAFEGRNGIAVGSFGMILGSADGGQHWSGQWEAPRGAALFGIARRAGKCVVVGQMGAIYSANDCRHWKAAPSVSTARLAAVSMNDSGTAYAVGAFGTVLKSIDWGASWSLVAMDWSRVTEQGAEPHLYAVAVGEDGVVTLAGEFELILRSSDGGAQWKVLHKGERSLFGLALQGKGKGYAVGQSGAVLGTADGGASWRSLDSGTTAILTGIVATAGGQVVASGVNTIVASRDNGASWQSLQSPMVKRAWHQAVAASEDAGGKVRLLTVGAGGLILEVNN